VRAGIAGEFGNASGPEEPMDCLDILRMVVSPSSAHAFRISVIRDDIAVIEKFFATYRTFPALLADLAVHELPHF